MKILELVLKPKDLNDLSGNKQLIQALFSYVCQTLDIQVISIAISKTDLTLWFKLPRKQDEKFLVESLYNISNRVITENLNQIENFWEDKYALNSFEAAAKPMHTKRLKVLVTGGAGFIGSNLVDGLIGAGYDVAVIDNLSTGKREYLNPQAKFYENDVSDEASMRRIFEEEKFDFVFHLAAQISVADSVKDPMYDMNANARGSFNVFNAAKETGVKRVVFISTGGALYGDVTEPAHENMPVAPTSPYAIHKFTAERYLELFRTEHKLNSITLRLANVYGPRQFKGGEGAAVAVFSHNAINNIPSTIFGDGSKTRDFVYVGDVVDACVKAMLSSYQGVANIGTGERISVLDLIKTIERVSDRRIEYSHGQDRPGEVQDSILSIERAREVLGWQPQVTLEEGLKRTLDWSKQ
jgi:UDP-glucose 4-epimerase